MLSYRKLDPQLLIASASVQKRHAWLVNLVVSYSTVPSRDAALSLERVILMVYEECLDARLGTKALVLAERLGLVATLTTARVGRASMAEATEDIALGAGLLGHGGNLLSAVQRGILSDVRIFSDGNDPNQDR